MESRRPNFNARLFLIVTMGVASLLQTLGAAPGEPDAAALEEIVAHVDRPPVNYRAFRRLEARTSGSQGWLNAWTEFDSVKGFRYEVVAEGGSGRIRNSVLRAVLDAEREASSGHGSKLTSFTLENYQFQPCAEQVVDGAVKLLLIPRRKDSRLIDGALLLARNSWEPIRLEGRLAKSPSFWIRSVNISWRYERVGSTVMPVQLDSQAQVKVVGPSTFRMTYDYEMVDGRTVGNALNTLSPATQ